MAVPAVEVMEAELTRIGDVLPGDHSDFWQ